MPKCALKRCGKKFAPKFSSLQKCCSLSCSIEYARIENEKKLKKAWNQEKKKIKEKLKTLSDYEAEARKIFQKWIRMRDQNLCCVSCQSSTSQIWDAGHFLKAELYSGLIFHEDNVWKQCGKCNRFLGGNELNYRIGLVKRIGEDRVKWLEENKDRLRNYKYTRDELINIKNEYTQKIKLWKK